MRVPTAPSSDSVICLNNSQTIEPYYYPFILKKIQLRNSQMEEMNRSKVKGKDHRVCLLQVHHLPAPPCDHQPGSSLKPFGQSLYESFITQSWVIKSLAIKGPQGLQDGAKSSKSLIQLVPLTNSPISIFGGNSHLININSGVIERSVMNKERHSFYLFHSGTILGMKKVSPKMFLLLLSLRTL